MTEMLSLVGDISTFLKAGWIVWLLWAAGLVVWYQRARVKVPAWPPAPQQSASAKATADRSVKSTVAKASVARPVLVKAKVDKSSGIAATPSTVGVKPALAQATADHAAADPMKTPAAPPKVIPTHRGFSPEFLAALGLEEPQPDDAASDTAPGQSVYS